MEEQLRMKETEEMKLRANIEEFQHRNSSESEVFNPTDDRLDNTLNR